VKNPINDTLKPLAAGELLLSTQLLNALQGVAIIACDASGNISYANQYAHEIFNLDVAEVLVGKGQLPATIQQRLSVELNNTNSEFSLQYGAGQSLRTLRVCKATLENSSATVTYLLQLHDITDQISTELQLKQSENLLRNLIEASPDFISFKDANNRWLEANSSSLDLLQLNLQDYQHKTDTELAYQSNPIFKDAFRHSKNSDEHAWLAGKTVRNEEIIALPQGGEKILDVIKVPLYNEDGSRHGLVTMGRDITERKVAENYLRDRSAILDALIACDWLLHSAESWETVAAKVLQQLCLGLRFSRAAILKNTRPKNGAAAASSHAKILYKWSTPGLISVDKKLEAIDFNHAHLQRWQDVLQHGDPIFSAIADLPSTEREILQQADTQSIAVVPLFLDKHWWGNIIIERCDGLSTTTAQELGSLMAVGRSLSVAIQRESADKRLHQATIAFDSATEGMMILDENAHIIAINKGYTAITGFAEHEVVGTAPKALHNNEHEVWQTLINQGKWCGEVTNNRKNSQIYQQWLTITAVKNPEGLTVNYVGVFTDITETKRAQNRLNELVNHDPLTGLPNRRLLNELLEHGLRRAGRENHQLALLFIDLDRFKTINDSLGHQVGDKLLHEAATRISICMRDSDIVARFGGDEFVVMMDMIKNPKDAALVAQKIIDALAVEFIIDSKEIFISASIGISVFPRDGDSAESLINAADVAMYQVKNKGKNNHCFYSDDLSKGALERFNMENQLRRALERDQFEVYYQPQVCLLSGDIIGAEALIRWNHPDLGLVSPATFIPVAEETGLIVQIGEWVLRQAALQVMCWIADGYAMQWISVNVSGVQIMRSNFADTVYGILVETDCNPAALELEVTESTVMQNTEYVIETFDRIKQLGLRLAIDDFGTGYSSLSNLKRLPLDKIKIDQSFVRGLPNDQNDAAIANAIYAMALSLGLSVIAEGVETLAQAEFLKTMGCHEGQGYLYSRPLTALAFSQLLAEKKQEKEPPHAH
jgi:diguanylate cyclase (GGDEF)-like protein/PAS domain S-box-containing protein